MFGKRCYNYSTTIYDRHPPQTMKRGSQQRKCHLLNAVSVWLGRALKHGVQGNAVKSQNALTNAKALLATFKTESKSK